MLALQVAEDPSSPFFGNSSRKSSRKSSLKFLGKTFQTPTKATKSFSITLRLIRDFSLWPPFLPLLCSRLCRIVVWTRSSVSPL
jgi:hypothetical protein